jgi:pimeloyl-ACP methyl ester carboxylesterase
VRRRVLLLALFLSSGFAASAGEAGKESPFPAGTSRHEAQAGRLAFTVHVPEARADAKGRWPLLVALHELGSTDEILAGALAPIADDGRYLLLCPKARGIGFAESDRDALAKTITAVGSRLDAEASHLLGVGDAGMTALRFALGRPRLLRGVVTLGTDVPAVKPARGSDRLRVLVMKGADDRPEAGRESVRTLREHVAVAEFREVPGAGLELDQAARDYVVYFLDAASGRCEAGKDRSLAWLPADRGLQRRKATKSPALVYLFDASPSHRARTMKIQNEILFDAAVREAAVGVVPILAPRKDAAKVVPDARLSPGPALVVLDRKGKVAGILQRKPGAKALAAVLGSL